MASALNLLTATAGEIQKLLTHESGLTSRALVDRYLAQIQQYDNYYRAVISTSPLNVLYQRADLLDAERKAGKIRGPLHGIPILVKDNINTEPSLGLDTTGGSLAFVGSRPRDNAPIVDKVCPGLILNFSGYH
jgi:amidase